MRQVSGEYLSGIEDRCVPLSQACPDKGSTSEHVMACILRQGDCCSQECFRIRELIVIPHIERSVVDLNVRYLGRECKGDHVAR